MQRISALLLKRGAPLRQTTGPHLAAAPWCMLTAQRYLSAKLFVGGLSFRTEEDGLKNAFAVFGEVWDAKIIMDRETGKSRGFGFVTFENEADAETAISKMNGSMLDGRAIRVDRAAARAPAPPLSSTASSRPMGSIFDSSGTSSLSDFDSPGPDTSNSGTAAGITSAFSDSSFSSATASNSSISTLSSSTTSVDSKPADVPRPIILGSTNDDKSLSGDSKPAEAPRRIILGSTNDDTMSGDSKPAEAPRRIILGSTSETSASSSPTNSAGKFDFSDFSSIDNSSYQNDLSLPRRPRIRPVSTLPRPRIRTPLSNTNFDLNFPSSADSKFPFNTPSAPPKPKGPDFDFGLSCFPSTPPTTESGVRPHGVFDVDLPDDLPELPPEEPKPKPTGLALFPLRTLPPLDLPWDTPEADNWSDIGKDPPKFDDFSSPYSPLRSFLKKEKELFWDPYNYDEDAKLPPEYLSEEEEEEDLSLLL